MKKSLLCLAAVLLTTTALAAAPRSATNPCAADCDAAFQRLCRQQGGICTLHPDLGFCGCYYP
jgi:Spy/CpxP family protein refolding chaperone